jgi:hypothetical protein
MATIVTRAGKGSPLTHNEVDSNFTNLNNDKIEASQSVTLTNKTLGAGTAITAGTINDAVIGGSTPAAGTFTSLSDSGNLTFTGTGNRITGDFSNATIANRVTFQTSTTNGVTNVAAIPNGTESTSALAAINNSDPTNAGLLQMSATSSEAQVQSTISGTGTYLPMTFYTGGSERMRLDTSGNVGIGTSTIGSAGVSLNSVYNVGWTQSAGESIPNIFRQASSAATVVANGYRYTSTANGFASSFSSSWAKSAVALNEGTVRFYTNTAAAVAAGTDVTPTERMRIDSSGGLILVGSTAQKATGTTWSNPSDQRLKDNIRDYTKGTTELMKVRVREWEYNGKGGTTEGMKGLGVIADEVMTVLPDTIENYDAKLNADDEETTAIKKFDATEITWLLVKTVQEQQALITTLTDRITALEAKG